jgi:hypothetical protein
MSALEPPTDPSPSSLKQWEKRAQKAAAVNQQFTLEQAAALSAIRAAKYTRWVWYLAVAMFIAGTVLLIVLIVASLAAPPA